MTVLHEIRKRARKILPPVLGACVVAYFGYHTLHGEHGLLAWLELRQDLAGAREGEARMAEQRARLDHRVRLLRRDGLDLDLLEEQAHALLSYGRRDERVILLRDPEGGGKAD